MDDETNTQNARGGESATDASVATGGYAQEVASETETDTKGEPIVDEAAQQAANDKESMLQRLRAVGLEIEEFAGHEANMAKTKLNEAIYWLTKHL